MNSTTARDDDLQEGDEHPLMFAVRAVDRFFFRPSDPTSLGLMRICTGIWRQPCWPFPCAIPILLARCGSWFPGRAKDAVPGIRLSTEEVWTEQQAWTIVFA